MKRIGSGLWLMQRITYCNAVRRADAGWPQVESRRA